MRPMEIVLVLFWAAVLWWIARTSHGGLKAALLVAWGVMLLIALSPLLRIF